MRLIESLDVQPGAALQTSLKFGHAQGHAEGKCRPP
jgi:hypothetical protein